jgi:phosphoglycerate dehydrogenase-like enzyme
MLQDDAQRPNPSDLRRHEAAHPPSRDSGLRAQSLVTGGAGFIGSALVRLLAERGYAVRVFDNLSNGSRTNLADTDAELVEGDVRA